MRTDKNLSILAIAGLLLLIKPSIASSQDTIPLFCISFNAGYSMPYGTFAQETFGGLAGFSSGGPVLDFQFQQYFGSYKIFGLFADASFTSHFFNERAYINAYRQVMGTEGDFIVNAGNYNFAETRLGFLLAIPASDRLRILLDAGLGAAFCYHPRISVYNTYWGQINTVTADLDAQFLGAAGLSVEYALNPYTAIYVTGSVHGFNPEFWDTEGVESINFDLKVRYANFTLGINRYF